MFFLLFLVLNSCSVRQFVVQMFIKRIFIFKKEIILILIEYIVNQIVSLRIIGFIVLIFFYRCRKKGLKVLWENRLVIKLIVFGGGKKEKKKKKKKGKKSKGKNKSG